MATLIAIGKRLEIPGDIQSLEDFRRWTYSNMFPQRGRIDYVQGRIEVHMSPEDLFTHGSPKLEITRVAGNVTMQLKHGKCFVDCTRLASVPAGLSVEPDLLFISNEAIRTGRVRLIPSPKKRRGRYIEIEGAADLVAEVLSDSSVKKDTQLLPPAYFAAGVLEFWLIDARKPHLQFTIHHRGAAEFVPVPRDADGWQYSAVMQHHFRLLRTTDELNHWVYELQVRESST
jgi:Uma2 family endonuclease